MSFKSDPQIGIPVDTGDRGIPSLSKDSTGNYQVSSLDSSGNIKFSDESIPLLRRILKVLESNNITDNKNRQKVIVEGIGTNSSPISTEINATIPVTATIASVTSLAAGGQGPTLGAPLLATTLYQPTWEGPVDQRWRVAEDSHISYQASIRSHLAFT
jgi:hypothetical protein